jgi:hypothetical protein
MPRTARALPPAASVPEAALHRRRQQVVVRKAGAGRPAPVGEADRRLHQPTIPGLGYRPVADTVPALGDDAAAHHDATPVSRVRTKVAPRGVLLPPPLPGPRARPVTLLDEVHDALSRQYLAEAERLLESGIFDGVDDWG